MTTAPHARPSPRTARAARHEGSHAAAAMAGGIRTARVIDCADDHWVVQCGALRRRARRAASCLLLPEAGDSVACLVDEAGRCWLVAVLERAADPVAEAGEAGSTDRATPRAPARLRVDGDLQLEVRGNWQVQAAQLSVRSDRAELRTGDARIGFDTLKSVGRVLQVTVQQTRWVGQELVAVVDRWMQHAKTTHRHTEGMEQASAGHMELAAQGVLHVKAPHVLTEGSDLVKTRGSQIHFG